MLLALATCALSALAANAAPADDWRRCETKAGVTFGAQIKACTRVIASASTSRLRLAIAHYNRGWAHRHTGRYDQAIADFDRAVAFEPNFEQAFRAKGHALRAKGLIARAIEAFDAAVAVKSDYAGAYLDRGAAYLALGKADRALEDLSQAVALLPDVAAHRFARAQAYERKAVLDLALADLDHAVALEPQTAAYLVARGRLNARLGRNDAAAADFARALALDPKLVGPRLWLRAHKPTAPTPLPLRRATLEPDERAAPLKLAWPLCGAIESAARADAVVLIRAGSGAKVQASADGLIVTVEPEDKGNVVEMRHADDTVTRYAGLSAVFVRPRDLVQAGQIIGQIALDQAGAKLRFAVFREGQAIDPLRALPPRKSCKR